MALKEKKFLCLFMATKKKKIKEVKGGKAGTKRSQASNKSKKNANVCAYTGRQVVPMDLWLPWRTPILIVKWEPHPWDEFFTQHLTPSRCLVSVSPSSEGCCPRKHQTKQSNGNYKVTSLFLSMTKSPEIFQSEQQSGANLKISHW